MFFRIHWFACCCGSYWRFYINIWRICLFVRVLRGRGPSGVGVRRYRETESRMLDAYALFFVYRRRRLWSRRPYYLETDLRQSIFPSALLSVPLSLHRSVTRRTTPVVSRDCAREVCGNPETGLSRKFENSIDLNGTPLVSSAREQERSKYRVVQLYALHRSWRISLSGIRRFDWSYRKVNRNIDPSIIGVHYIVQLYAFIVDPEGVLSRKFGDPIDLNEKSIET